jgi:hypothetical protein
MADEDLDGADFEDSEIDDNDGEMPWESHAREASERVLAEATFDKTIAARTLSKGSIRLTSS